MLFHHQGNLVKLTEHILVWISFHLFFHLFKMWHGMLFQSLCSDQEKSGKLSSAMSSIFALVFCPRGSNNSYRGF